MKPPRVTTLMLLLLSGLALSCSGATDSKPDDPDPSDADTDVDADTDTDTDTDVDIDAKLGHMTNLMTGPTSPWVGLDFEGPCDTEVTGAPGAEQELTIWARVVTDRLSAGIDGWSIGMAIVGGEISEMSIEETDAYPYVNPETGFVVTQAATGEGKVGAVASLIPAVGEAVVFPENTAFTVLQLTVSVTIPESGSQELHLFFTDDMQGLGQPVKNLLVVQGRSLYAELGKCRVILSAD